MRPAFHLTLERILYAGAALLLGYWLWVAADGLLSQSSLAGRLAALGIPIRSDVSFHTARRTRREARRSGLVGEFTIPRLKLSAMIVEGTSTARLSRGVGHVSGSAFPGERGNVVLAAHRDTYFRGLRGVVRGDRVILTTPDGVFHYRVDSTLVVRPDRTDLIERTSTSELTLVTCYPFHWIGPAPDRFIVRSSPERYFRARQPIAIHPPGRTRVATNAAWPARAGRI